MPTELTIPKIPTALPEIFRKILSGQLPSPREFVDQHLAAIGTVEAGLILVVGLTFLLFGWGAFKLFVIGNGAYFGGMLGAHAAGTYIGPTLALLGMLAGGLVLAVLSLPLIRYAVTVVGGLGGGLLGYHSWAHVVHAFARDDLARYPWVGALIGIFMLGFFAFALFRLMVMIVTAFEGSVLAFSGALALCLHHPPISDTHRPDDAELRASGSDSDGDGDRFRSSVQRGDASKPERRRIVGEVIGGE